MVSLASMSYAADAGTSSRMRRSLRRRTPLHGTEASTRFQPSYCCSAHSGANGGGDGGNAQPGGAGAGGQHQLGGSGSATSSVTFCTPPSHWLHGVKVSCTSWISSARLAFSPCSPRARAASESPERSSASEIAPSTLPLSSASPRAACSSKLAAFSMAVGLLRMHAAGMVSTIVSGLVMSYCGNCGIRTCTSDALTYRTSLGSSPARTTAFQPLGSSCCEVSPRMSCLVGPSASCSRPD